MVFVDYGAGFREAKESAATVNAPKLELELGDKNHAGMLQRPAARWSACYLLEFDFAAVGYAVVMEFAWWSEGSERTRWVRRFIEVTPGGVRDLAPDEVQQQGLVALEPRRCLPSGGNAGGVSVSTRISDYYARCTEQAARSLDAYITAKAAEAAPGSGRTSDAIGELSKAVLVVSQVLSASGLPTDAIGLPELKAVRSTATDLLAVLGTLQVEQSLRSIDRGNQERERAEGARVAREARKAEDEQRHREHQARRDTETSARDAVRQRVLAAVGCLLVGPGLVLSFYGSRPAGVSGTWGSGAATVSAATLAACLTYLFIEYWFPKASRGPERALFRVSAGLLAGSANSLAGGPVLLSVAWVVTALAAAGLAVFRGRTVRREMSWLLSEKGFPALGFVPGVRYEVPVGVVPDATLAGSVRIPRPAPGCPNGWVWVDPSGDTRTESPATATVRRAGPDVPWDELLNVAAQALASPGTRGDYAAVLERLERAGADSASRSDARILLYVSELRRQLLAE
jgi:hypothetical protein